MGKIASAFFTVAVLAVSSSFLVGTGAFAENVRVVPDSAAQVQLSLAGVVRRAAPAVVNIFTKSHRRERGYDRGHDRGYDRGYDEGDGGFEQQQQRRGRSPGALGS